MAITQVGSATTATTDGSTTDMVVTKPTGTASGHVLIAVVSQNENTLTLPSGFVLVAERTGADTTNTFSGHVYRKVAGGSEPSTYTFSKLADGGPGTVVLSAWDGVDNTTPIDTSGSLASAGVAEPGNPALTITTTNNARVFTTRHTRNVSGVSGTPEAPVYSEASGTHSIVGQVAAFSGGTSNYGCCLVQEDTDRGPAAGITEAPITVSRTETDNVWVMFALRATAPADTDTGSGTEGAESISGTAVDTDTGTGTETESINIPIADSDTGTGTEGAEGLVQTTHHIQYDDFNRDNESPLNISSSGAVWTNI